MVSYRCKGKTCFARNKGIGEFMQKGIAAEAGKPIEARGTISGI